MSAQIWICHLCRLGGTKNWGSILNIRGGKGQMDVKNVWLVNTYFMKCGITQNIAKLYKVKENSNFISHLFQYVDQHIGNLFKNIESNLSICDDYQIILLPLVYTTDKCYKTVNCYTTVKSYITVDCYKTF